MKTEFQRVFEKATIGDGCWEWQACKTPGGYGRMMFRGRMTTGHRAAMIVTGHDVPVGMHVDHICKNIVCIRPSHLRVVTPRQNVRYSDAVTGINSRKTHCKRGHPLSGNNLYERPYRGITARQCLTCRRAASRASVERR